MVFHIVFISVLGFEHLELVCWLHFSFFLSFLIGLSSLPRNDYNLQEANHTWVENVDYLCFSGLGGYNFFLRSSVFCLSITI